MTARTDTELLDAIAERGVCVIKHETRVDGHWIPEWEASWGLSPNQAGRGPTLRAVLNKALDAMAAAAEKNAPEGREV